jgi:hypothetical protein
LRPFGRHYSGWVRRSLQRGLKVTLAALVGNAFLLGLFYVVLGMGSRSPAAERAPAPPRRERPTTVALDVAVGTKGRAPSPSRIGQGAASAATQRSLRLPRGVELRQRHVRARSVRVLALVGRRVFWIGNRQARLLVHYHGRGTRWQLRVGQRLSFDAMLVRNRANIARALGIARGEGTVLLLRQGRHIEVDGMAIRFVTPWRHPPRPRPSALPAPRLPSIDEAHRLNDQAYTLLRRGSFDAALPLLSRAVAALAAAPVSDPYRGYANYKLGYTLLHLRRCASARIYLRRADQLEPANNDVRHALAAADACR